MFSRLKIGWKFVGLISALLMAMLFVSAYSFIKMRGLRDEIVDLSQDLIPLVNALTQVDVLVLEQTVMLERLIRKDLDGNYQESERTNDRQAFDLHTGNVRASIQKARSLVDRGVKRSLIVEDAVELARTQMRLEQLTERYDTYVGIAEVVVHHEASQALTSAQQSRAEQEAASIDSQLSELLHELEIFTAKRAKRLQQDEESFFMLSLENLVLAVLAFVLGVVVAVMITRRIVRPIHQLVDATRNVSEGRLDVEVAVPSKDEVGQLAHAFNHMVDELRVKERVKETFGKYLDPRIVETIMQDSDANAAGGQKQEMTVFFSDVAGFSTLAEQLTPSGLVKVINRYLSLATEPIAEHRGVVDKFIGDAVMAFWGPPFCNKEEHAKLACKAALAQFDQLERLQSAMPDILGFRKELPQISIRIGLCTGDVVVGSIGSDQSRSYTVMGDTVNIASRLEGANKYYSTRILISENTRSVVKDDFETREIDRLTVVGKRQSLRVFELMAEKGQLADSENQLGLAFEKGLSAYRAQQWSVARASFQECLRMRSDDGPAQVFLERVNELEISPPGPNWDGIWRLTAK